MKHEWGKAKELSNIGLRGTLHLCIRCIPTLILYSLPSVPTGRVIFEIGGVPIREELARECMSFDCDSLTHPE